jgi:uncharacterized protein (TIGR02246 family)
MAKVRIRQGMVLLLTLLLMALLLSCKKDRFTAGEISLEKHEVDSLYTAWWQAWLDNDLEAWSEPICQDAVFLGWPSEFLSGKNLIVQAAQQRMARLKRVVKQSESERVIWQVHPREGFVWVEAQQKVTRHVGEAEIERIINHTTVFEKRETGWVIMQHHCSSGSCEAGGS